MLSVIWLIRELEQLKIFYLETVNMSLWATGVNSYVPQLQWYIFRFLVETTSKSTLNSMQSQKLFTYKGNA